jgi:hypothetical protein
VAERRPEAGRPPGLPILLTAAAQTAGAAEAEAGAAVPARPAQGPLEAFHRLRGAGAGAGASGREARLGPDEIGAVGAAPRGQLQGRLGERRRRGERGEWLEDVGVGVLRVLDRACEGEDEGRGDGLDHLRQGAEARVEAQAAVDRHHGVVHPDAQTLRLPRRLCKPGFSQGRLARFRKGPPGWVAQEAMPMVNTAYV